MARPDVMDPRELALCLFLSLVLFSTIGQRVAEGHDQMPEFLFPLENYTVTQGRDVFFTCVVNHLQSYRVAWIKSDSRAILSMHTHMVSPNSRLSVTHNGHNTWKLHVVDVQPEDAGTYMCQVNTDPMRSQTGYMKVQTPPDIMDHSADGALDRLTCLEGGSVRLRCQATGNPEPEVTWRREDGKNITLRTENSRGVVIYEEVKMYKNEYLQLNGVQRQEMGSYLCIASNGVPPSVSKRYYVNVHFKPTIKAKDPLVLAHVNSDAVLECLVESWPKSLTTWYTENGTKVVEGERHIVTVESSNKIVYSFQNNLKIQKIQPADFGAYTCFTGNSYGKSTATIRLKEQYKLKTTKTPFVSRKKAPLPERKVPNSLRVAEKSSRYFKDEMVGGSKFDVEEEDKYPALHHGSTDYPELFYLNKATSYNGITRTIVMGCLIAAVLK